MRMWTSVQLTALSLFSGAGGMAEGFRQAGFDAVLACDSSADAATTFCLNHPETPFVLGDISDLLREASSLPMKEPPDVVLGGPPCQGFSVGGPRDPDHPSNQLVWQFVKAVRFFEPLAFVMENVPGLLNMDNGMLLDRIVRALEAIDGGYNVQFEILNAADFGVPQTRRRVFLVGTRRGIQFHFPRRTHFPRTYVTVAQAIGDLPIETAAAHGVTPYPTPISEADYQRERRKGSFAVFNHNCKRLMKLRLSRIQHMDEGDTKRVIPEHLQAGGRDSKYRRLDSNRPSPTVTAHLGKDSSDFIHPWLPRPITVREAARLQSFDDRYKFCGSQVQQLIQVGNAVPPLLAKAVSEGLRGALLEQKFKRAVRVILSLSGVDSLWASTKPTGALSLETSHVVSKGLMELPTLETSLTPSTS